MTCHSANRAFTWSGDAGVREPLPGFFRHHDERRPKISKKSWRCCFPDCGIIGSMVINTKTPVVRTTTSVSICRRKLSKNTDLSGAGLGPAPEEALAPKGRQVRGALTLISLPLWALGDDPQTRQNTTGDEPDGNEAVRTIFWGTRTHSPGGELTLGLGTPKP